MTYPTYKTYKSSFTRDRLFTAAVYILLFLYSLYPYIDFDWGWHYRYGQYFWQHFRLYSADTFSWTLPGYAWINHSWAYDPLLYLTFNAVGFLGLSIIGALICVAIFYFLTKPFKLSFWQKGLLAIPLVQLTSGVVWQGPRSQIISLLFLSILMYLIFKDRQVASFAYLQKKWVLWSLPVFFFFWANFHGYFTLGLLILGIFVTCQIIETVTSLRVPASGGAKQSLSFKRLLRRFTPRNDGTSNWPLIASFLASIAVTLINPFGFRVYEEALRHSSSPLLHYILEWDPVQIPSEFFTFFACFVLLLSAGLIWRIIKKQSIHTDLPMIICSLIVLYLAWGARRYMAVFIVVTIPFAALILQDLKLNLEKLKATGFVFIILCAISLEIALFRRLPPYHLTNFSFNDYCQQGSHCSTAATDYLIAHPPQGAGFNFYDWGGFLIGRGVPVKLFIDGRMHLWEKDNYSPFLDYQKIFYEGDVKRFDKYHFDWVFVPKGASLLKALESGDHGSWQEVFGDEMAVLLIRK